MNDNYNIYNSLAWQKAKVGHNPKRQPVTPYIVAGTGYHIVSRRGVHRGAWSIDWPGLSGHSLTAIP